MGEDRNRTKTYDAPAPGKVGKCPRCGHPARWAGNAFRPFCSERCKMIDLGAWADEEYAVPGEPLPTEEEREE
jgi:hypothetical protein